MLKECDQFKRLPLHMALGSSHPGVEEVVKFMLETHPALAVEMFDGNYPIHMAAGAGKERAAKAILEALAVLGAPHTPFVFSYNRSYRNQLPLEIAIRLRHTGIACLLADHPLPHHVCIPAYLSLLRTPNFVHLIPRVIAANQPMPANCWAYVPQKGPWLLATFESVATKAPNDLGRLVHCLSDADKCHLHTTLLTLHRQYRGLPQDVLFKLLSMVFAT